MAPRVDPEAIGHIISILPYDIIMAKNCSNGMTALDILKSRKDIEQNDKEDYNLALDILSKKFQYLEEKKFISREEEKETTQAKKELRKSGRPIQWLDGQKKDFEDDNNLGGGGKYASGVVKEGTFKAPNLEVKLTLDELDKISEVGSESDDLSSLPDVEVIKYNWDLPPSYSPSPPPEPKDLPFLIEESPSPDTAKQNDPPRYNITQVVPIKTPSPPTLQNMGSRFKG